MFAIIAIPYQTLALGSCDKIRDHPLLDAFLEPVNDFLGPIGVAHINHPSTMQFHGGIFINKKIIAHICPERDRNAIVLIQDLQTCDLVRENREETPDERMQAGY